MSGTETALWLSCLLVKEALKAISIHFIRIFQGRVLIPMDQKKELYNGI